MKRFFTFFFLALLLIILLNLPRHVNVSLSSFFSKNKSALHAKKDRIESLEKANFDLVREIEQIREYLLDEGFLTDILNKVRSCEGLFESEKIKSYFDRRKAEFLLHLKKKLMGIRAQVVFRDPRPFSTGLWIDRGQKDNRRLGSDVICKNSPVIKGDCVVGLVEQVLENKSYVRLISDPKVVVSVRSQRGSLQKYSLLQCTKTLINDMKQGNVLKHYLDQNPDALKTLKDLESKIQESKQEGLFAKGEISGSKNTSFRTMNQCLNGTGFNMEFSDIEATGINLHDKEKSTLLQTGDILVTTGLDGIFPSNLRVARVTKIESLREGAYYYNLEAAPLVNLIYDLNSLEVLAPIIQSE